MLLDTYQKFPEVITIKYVVTLMTCVIKDDGKFHPQLFLGEAFLLKQAW